MRTKQLLSAVLLLPCCIGFSGIQPLQKRSRRLVQLAGAPLVEEDIEVVESKSTPRTQANGDLPTVLQGIADERSEFNMNLGKAMDTLRRDMPEILRRKPGKNRH